MAVNFGSTEIGQIRFGATRITKAYFGNRLIYDQPFVKIKFYFDRTNINPRSKLGPRASGCGAEWISDPNDNHIWYVLTPLYIKGAGTNDPLMGIGKLFCDSNDNGVLLSGSLGTCQVLEITGDYDRIQTIDRIFQRCTSITSVSTSGFYAKFANSTKLENVNSVCCECTNISDGSSLAGYNILSQIASVTTHSATFSQADSAASLAQIPTSWGGTLAPPATQLACTKYNAAGWTVNTSDPDCPDFTTVTTIEVFTTSSISKYAGVNMNKSNIWNRRNGFSNSTNTPTYYYPCFFQGTGSWPTGGSSAYAPTWIFCPGNYNGTLPSGQDKGDMPGTLDHETYGPFECRYGTFDSTKQVYFGFLVLNDPSHLSGFNPASTKFGIHSNNNFIDMTLNWYIPN